MRNAKKADKPVPVQNPVIDTAVIEIDGERFELCFDFGAMARVKAELREHGIRMNLLRSLDLGELDVDTLPVLFFATARARHPDLTWERAQALVTVRTAAGLIDALVQAYKVAMEPAKADPPLAATEA